MLILLLERLASVLFRSYLSPWHPNPSGLPQSPETCAWASSLHSFYCCRTSACILHALLRRILMLMTSKTNKQCPASQAHYAIQIVSHATDVLTLLIA